MFKFVNIKVGKKFIVVTEPPVGLPADWQGPAPVFVKVSETHAIRLCDGDSAEIPAAQRCWVVLL